MLYHQPTFPRGPIRGRRLFAAFTPLTPFPAFPVVAWWMLAIGFGGTLTAGERIDFNRDVRAILSDKCFLCHGPDESTREAGLRLDDRDIAMEFSAIDPDDPDASEMLARITSDDPDLVMPPPSMGKPVTASEANTLRQWIQQGAAYDEHWAFVPPQRPAVPPIEDVSWVANDIDRFVVASLRSSGRQPAAPADVMTLVRRLHLDLTGLPPSVATLDRFDEALPVDQQRDRIDALIDDLLQSDHFGERWARWWLDAARYADSAGYEKDMQRQVFFYRDWVIDAMNRDYPYNEFIIDQVAGDLRPGAGQPERVATGFLRHSMTNEEGGADPEQFRVEAMFDRVDAIGKAVLGITTQCAQCHTHKYDPLSHREYYQMFAALNDFHEACVTVYTPAEQAARDEVLAKIQSLENGLRDQHPDWRAVVRAWSQSIARSQPVWTTQTPTDVPFEGQKFRILDDGSVLSESYAPTKADNDFSLLTHVGTITAVRLDAMTHPQLPRGGPGRSIDGTGALSEFELTVTPTAPGSEPIKVSFVRAMSDVNAEHRTLKPAYRDRDAAQDDRVVGPVAYAIDGDPKTAWTTDIGPGRSNQSRHAIFVAQTPVTINGEAKLTFTMRQKHGGWNSDDNQNFLIGRYRFSTTDADFIGGSTVDTSLESQLSIHPDDWSAEQWSRAFSAWRSSVESFAATNQAIETLWASHPETATQLVVQAREKPLPTYVLSRGDFLSPAESVQPDAPEFLHAMPISAGTGDAASPDRLRFAQWLVDDDSPTTARVVVNRIWQAYFGRGLVATPEDFGFQSSPPMHPGLLDFLAVELMDSGWSLKHIHGLIVGSRTYQQTAHVDPAAYRDDPFNEALARGPRFRVEAEMVRDVALVASGLINPAIGGPSVYPPAPDFLFQPPTSYGPKIWDTDLSGDEYRRSLYVHQYRSVPYPPLQVFDSPKGDAACVRRERSNTPLQALVMLNEPQFVEAARAMAARVLREIPAQRGECDRIDHAFRLCTSRRPDPVEQQILLDVLHQEIDEQPDALEKLLGVSPRVLRQWTGVDAVELARWMAVCRTILNLDETITKS